MNRNDIKRDDMISCLDSKLFNRNLHIVRGVKGSKMTSFFKNAYVNHLQNLNIKNRKIFYFDFKQFRDVFIHQAKVIQKYIEYKVDTDKETVILILDDIFVKYKVYDEFNKYEIEIEDKWEDFDYSYIDLLFHFLHENKWEVFLLSSIDFKDFSLLKSRLNYRVDETWFLPYNIHKNVNNELITNWIKGVLDSIKISNLNYKNIDFIDEVFDIIKSNLYVKISDNFIKKTLSKHISLDNVKYLINLINKHHIFKKVYSENFTNKKSRTYYKFYVLDDNLLVYLYQNNYLNYDDYIKNLVYIKLLTMYDKVDNLEFITFRKKDDITIKVINKVDFVCEDKELKFAFKIDLDNANNIDCFKTLQSYKKIYLTKAIINKDLKNSDIYYVNVDTFLNE